GPPLRSPHPTWWPPPAAPPANGPSSASAPPNPATLEGHRGGSGQARSCCTVHARGPSRSRTGREMSGAESLRSRSPPMKDKRLKKRQDREGRIVDDIDRDEPPGEGAEAEDQRCTDGKVGHEEDHDEPEALQGFHDRPPPRAAR